MNHQPSIPVTTTLMESVQWFIFLLASSVAMPIVIGSIYGMSFVEVAGLMQRTFFIVGVASLLQGLIGHRLPIMEGPAGIWISIFTVMSITGSQQGATATETLQLVEGTMIWTGGFLLLFGAFKLTEKILFVFTPLVTGTFFILLTVQLSGTFLEGMLGLQDGAESIQPIKALLAFITFLSVLGLSIFARGWLSSYAVLIGIVIGWIAYLFVFGFHKAEDEVSFFSLPELFAWGTPNFDLSSIPIAFVTAVILISNVVASVIAANQSLGNEDMYSGKQINKGTAYLGINHGLAGMFSAVANVPLATSAGFISLTGQKRKMPFLIASTALIIIAFFPFIVTWISGIPSPIANAALMATFVQLVGLALRNITSQPLDSRKTTIVGVAYLIGIGTMFLPSEVFAELPSLVQNLASNGLLLGTGLVILIEQLWKEKTS
ncbi:purine/pyrimidine permease [Radiobacillus kanasensis]|uniref:purine/pyrimidine permease n=1 Tax=Radiobacillus kanasensis TaxID=2844358 RepID=UPI001E4E19D1|nr:purine/pyrimidine permease [Radiobacillus kanasensis]UFT99112.1 purine/pyrimidine permease [Radiobacillus kanasensis]